MRTGSVHKGRPSARVIVIERNAAARRTGLTCRDQLDIRFRAAVLPAFFFRQPSERVIDLMRILASVAHADRRVTRRPSVCWRRDLEIDIPVSEPEFWFHEIKSKLIELLDRLTGDCWALNFRKSRSVAELPPQAEIEFPPHGELVTAYSNGLDSFAVVRLVASGQIQLHPGAKKQQDMVLVTTGREINAELKQIMTPFGYSVRQVSVPFVISRHGENFQLRETSFRSRALLFQTMAALAAAQSGGNTVIISESGQGSLGPWLTITGQECADIRTHPLFTSALSELLEAILGTRIDFQHPQLWETKGQTLSRLVANGLHEGWNKTFSCAAQVRHQQSRGQHLHCGVCPNCLLRRQSLLAAALEDPDEQYDCDDTLVNGRGLATQKLRRRVAQGLLPLIQLAQLKATPLLARTADRQLASFARDMQLDINRIRERTDTLIDVHRRELADFVKSRPKASLVRQLGEALS